MEKKTPNLTPEQVGRHWVGGAAGGKVVEVIEGLNMVFAFLPRLMPHAATRAMMAGVFKPSALLLQLDFPPVSGLRGEVRPAQ